MKLKSRWLLGSAALCLITVSITVYAVSNSKSQMEFADTGIETSPANPVLREAVRVREFIAEKNMYLTEAEVNRLTMSFLAASEAYGVDLWLLLSVAASESHFRAEAVSRVGCIGIMQIKPSTARSMGIDPQRLYKPEVNINAGAQYLRMLLDKYNDISLALAAYNAGPSRVRSSVPAIRETRQYVRLVSTRHSELIALGKGISD